MSLRRSLQSLAGLLVALAVLGTTVFGADAMQIFVKTLTGKTFTASVYQDSAGELWIGDGTPARNAAGEPGYTAEDVIVDRATGETYTLIAWIFESVREPGVYTVLNLSGNPVDEPTAASALNRLSSGNRVPTS